MERVCSEVNQKGIFLSKVDLETDLIEELSVPILTALSEQSNESAIKYLQKQKAVRMHLLLQKIKPELSTLNSGELVKPLLKIIDIVKGL